MKILVTGDRHWSDRALVARELKKVSDDGATVLVHGAANEADTIAGEVWAVLDSQTLEYPADWGKLGKKADILRNQQMLDENSDISLIIAFHDDLAKSKGTGDMVRRARKAGIEVRVVTH